MNKVKRKYDTPESRSYWDSFDKSLENIKIRDEKQLKKDCPWLYKNYSSGDYE